MSEIEAFPRAVLSHHYPETPLHGDFTTIRAGEYESVDALVGGTPCQSFSVAGLRGGLADERGNLALEYLRLAERLRPSWLVWENVPGVLSSGGGRDFGAFVGGLAELGYGWAYRVLDAQYFGLAQRRKRVFVVGYLGDWRRAAAVLFEPASLRGNPPPSRATGKGTSAPVAGSLNSSIRRGTGGAHETDFLNVANPLGSHKEGGWRGDLDNDTFVTRAIRPRNLGSGGAERDGADNLVAMSLDAHGGSGRMDGESETFVCFDSKDGTLGEEGISSALTTNGDERHCGGRLAIAHSLRGDGFDASEDGTGRGTPLVFNHKASAHQSMNPGPISPGLDIGKSDGLCVAFQTSQSGVRGHETHATLDANNGSRRHNGAIVGSAVRRLTPEECEKLQGFPPGYTLIPYRGKPASDGPRYRALGNSMAVPVMAWIGKRMAAQSKQTRPKLFG